MCASQLIAAVRRTLPSWRPDLSRRSAGQSPRRVTRQRSTAPRGRAAVAYADADADADLEPLTKAQIRELRRRIRDFDDPIRYLLVSDLGPRFKLYYDVSDGVYVMNDPSKGTLFKTRAVAVAVKATLGPGIRVVRCDTKIKDGTRVPVLRRRAGPSNARRAPSRRTKR
jgi:hypothetical protein